MPDVLSELNIDICVLHAALKLEYMASVEKNRKDCSLKVVHCEKYMLKMVSSLC
jgi:hypothetical protein